MKIFGCDHVWTDWVDNGEAGPVVMGVSATGYYEFVYHRLSRHCLACLKGQSNYVGMSVATEAAEATRDPARRNWLWRRLIRS